MLYIYASNMEGKIKKIYIFYFLPRHDIALIAGHFEIITLRILKIQEMVFYSCDSKRMEVY
jgi:hypothetical protein